MKSIIIAALLGAVAAVERRHHHHHHHKAKFADGMTWNDKLDETIRVKDTDHGGRLLPVHLNQKKFASGYSEDEELGESLRMKENDARKSKNAFRNYKFEKKQPVDDAFIQFDLAGTKGPGLPDAPAGNAPLSPARGEKEWQTWAQDFVDWEDKQTDIANARKPYVSTLVSLNANDDDFNKMENFMMEDPDIPLNMRLVHIQNNQGDDLIMIDKE